MISSVLQGLTDCTKGQLAKAASAAECYQFSAPPRDDSCPVLSRVSSCPKRLEGNDVIKVQVSEDQKQVHVQISFLRTFCGFVVITINCQSSYVTECTVNFINKFDYLFLNLWQDCTH